MSTPTLTPADRAAHFEAQGPVRTARPSEARPHGPGPVRGRRPARSVAGGILRRGPSA
jgi:hypothetical protein